MVTNSTMITWCLFCGRLCYGDYSWTLESNIWFLFCRLFGMKQKNCQL